jgi:ferredoxin-NADP reductase
MPVTLLYANDDEKSIAFKDELDNIATSGVPQLKVVHVLSKPDIGWTGETGFIDQAKIEKYCGGELNDKGFYLCGPKPFLDAIVRTLHSKGVAAEHIHMEFFSFLG